MKVTRTEILEYLKNNRSEFEHKYFISEVGLFGSFARNDETEDSDIDIIYNLQEGKTITFFQLCDLEKQIQSYFNRRIELINYKYMNPIVKYKALKDIIYV